ncbi:glycosyltransferase family 2 protein [Luedemannella helvata]|uniref:Glycosyltransferase n=1 Tax=Luedemannella helvata TaxID=349315 RepID=A0ABN2KV29_9ACTN
MSPVNIPATVAAVEMAGSDDRRYAGDVPVVEPDLSVVIPTHNRAERLHHTLRALAGQRLPRDRFEVVIADDGSTDDTAAVVAAFEPDLTLRYARLDRDEADIAAHGYCVSGVRNAGARLAGAPLIVFLDCGVIAGPDLLAAHLAAHAGAGPARSVLGYAFGTHKFRPFPDLAQLLRTRSPEEVAAAIGAGPRGLDLRHDVLPADGDLTGLAGPWILCWTLNMSVRATDFRAVGGFDENFRGWGYEDVELGYRLHRAGTRLVASRDAWGIEWPDRPDLAALETGAARNIEVFLARHRHPDVELYACARGRNILREFERDHAALRAWTLRVRGLDPLPDLTGLPAAERMCVLGSGGVVPAGWPPTVLVDFDAEALSRLPAAGGHTPLHAVGLRTGLPDRAFDLVVITSRLAGVWDRWGGQLLAEARRVGRQVVCFADAAAPTVAGAR